MTVLTALALGRFLRDGAALVLLGASVFLAVLAPAALRAHLRPGWAAVATPATAVLVLAVAALLPVQAAMLGAGWRDAFDPAMLRALVCETNIGMAWMLEASAACGLLLVGALPTRPRLWATITFSAALLAATTLTGHAAMRDGGAGLGQRGLVLLHTLAGGFWLGGLLPLLPTLRALGHPQLHRDAATALRRFSMLGHGAVALVLVTGSVDAIAILGHWPRIAASPYEALLMAKVGCVATMTGLALLNRYRFVPLIPGDPVGATRRIRHATVIEIVLGLGAVALVALFGLLEPV